MFNTKNKKNANIQNSPKDIHREYLHIRRMILDKFQQYEEGFCEPKDKEIDTRQSVTHDINATHRPTLELDTDEEAKFEVLKI